MLERSLPSRLGANAGPQPFRLLHAALGLLTVLCAGCSNIIETKLMSSKSLFFQPGNARTLYIQHRNISENQQVSLADLPAKLRAKGYRVTERPEDARFVLQTKVVYCNIARPEVSFDSVLAGGFGAGIGTLAPPATASPGMPGVPPGMPNMAAIMEQVRMEQMRMARMNGGGDELENTVLYFCAADVQITEQASPADSSAASRTPPASSTDPARQIRIVAGVRQKQLNVEEATPVVRDKLTTGVAGIF